MSISGALSNALSGLSAASRAVSLVSTNIANAMTDGYGRRDIELAARGIGGGVDVVSVTRSMNQTVLTDRRSADAEVARSGVQSDFYASVADAIGEPGSGYSLSDLIAGFESALTSAAAQPDSEPRLQQSVDAAKSLAVRLDQISDSVQTERGRADTAIASAVSELNENLAQIEQLNTDIRKAWIAGDTASALVDQRQSLIDKVSAIVPVRELDRGYGTVALLSEGGLLLDGKAPVIGFQAATMVVAQSSLAGSTLSGITVNGVPVDTTRDRHLLSGGKLDGLFAVRDEVAPAVQSDLDALARDLMERFEASGVDPTLAPGSAGLFTDNGLPFAVANEVGLAGRLTVNAAVDPDQGGAVWRLRDGLGATSQGNVGDSSGIVRLRTALTGLRSPASGGLGSTARDAGTLAADLLSAVGVRRDGVDGVAAYAGARSSALTERLAEDGVDSDAEMQKLLLLEQAYAANARVVTTAQSMIDTLLEM
ncbi:MAG: flagellar hook-associated protein FlgK [Rhodobacteraceae bacterium]|nr:flagellar hook-associated protein FlgK [Paracoccaceae bacterium]